MCRRGTNFSRRAKPQAKEKRKCGVEIARRREARKALAEVYALWRDAKLKSAQLKLAIKRYHEVGLEIGHFGRNLENYVKKHVRNDFGVKESHNI